MNSSPLNYIIIITNIHMKKSMHINVCIPITITHVKDNRKTEEQIFFSSTANRCVLDATFRTVFHLFLFVNIYSLQEMFEDSKG